jgi:hypothetical protein
MEARRKGREGEGLGNGIWSFSEQVCWGKSLKRTEVSEVLLVWRGGAGQGTDILTGNQKAPLQLWFRPGRIQGEQLIELKPMLRRNRYGGGSGREAPGKLETKTGYRREKSDTLLKSGSLIRGGQK